ncbi:hypothetical protein GRI99_12350 [Altererythrobacter buctensis]|uniref:Uncharacterized protein n=1 Tax=Alteraurantiacibacter buctensis TaxID=1503981 RepID=A0A844YXY2_9SPHN|nr:hypothetical protein [Alteraurantiacibacter buctensis]
MPEAVGLATQEIAPAPDYAPLILSPRQLHSTDEIVRHASGPPPADAAAVGDLWVRRLEQRGALMGSGRSGKGEGDPVSMIDTLLTARQFDAWAQENGWTVPRHIIWRFQQELHHPALPPQLAGAVHLWPASTRRTGWQLEAAFTGRVFLRNGCVYVSSPGQQGEALAWFHAETGLGRDGDGYFTLVNRVTGETMARLGEEMQWAGPNAIDQEQPQVQALQAACGDLPVVSVGNPEALERIFVRYPHLRTLQIPPPPPPAPLPAS